MQKLPIEKSMSTSGQALLIVLLSMAVILTVVLSVASKSIVDISTTSYEEDALRAFSAAEAGVEQVLLQQAPVTQTLDPSANIGFDAQITTPTLGNIYNYPVSLTSGEIGTVWFTSHDPSTGALTCSPNCTRANRIQVCFGNTTSEHPAVVLEIYYDPSQQAFANPNTFAGMQVVREPRDSLGSRTTLNNFGNASGGCAFGGGYVYQTGSINLTTLISSCAVNNINCLVMARIRMLYNTSPQPIAVRMLGGGNPNLPAQGYQIESTGTAGESVRSLNVLRGYADIQSPFNSAVFSTNGMTKP